MRRTIKFAYFLPAICLLTLSGCGGDADSSSETSASSTPSATPATQPATSGSSDNAGESELPKITIPAVKLGGGAPDSTSDSAMTSGRSNSAPKIDDVIDALKPIQVVLGNWSGSRNRSGGIETHEWVWDLRTNRNQPALVLSTDDGAFFRNARLTFDPARSKYLMTTVDEDEIVRQFEGGFVEEPQDVAGEEDSKKLQRTFKLQLTEAADPDRKERFEYEFIQQNNNRYQVYVRRARGSAQFALRDVIGSQRDGTSFAKPDDDYGDRTCIISQGLGTMAVTHDGKTYYVCCSGCKAAFEDDPERWIARLSEQMKDKESKD